LSLFSNPLKAATVACRDLGFLTGRAVWYGGGYWGAGSLSSLIHINHLSCSGDEDKLSDCKIRWGSGNCNHYQDVGKCKKLILIRQMGIGIIRDRQNQIGSY
jgi:hypothetical protein